MKSQKVSVIIPIYNSEKTIERCLESVLSQDYDNYEIIAVNNNSSDKTKEIIADIMQKDGRIKYVFEEKIGRGSARNVGVKAAKGEIIAMIDSDCIAPKDWISELTKPIANGKEAAVMGSERNLINNFWTKNTQRFNNILNMRTLNGEHINHIDTKNFAIDAGLIKKLMFDSELNSMVDFDLYLRLKRLAKIQYLANVKVGHYHKRSMKEVVELNFRRGFWTKKIYDKYKGINEPMTESVSIYNFITFPFWMLLQFIKKPLGEAYFLLVSEVSWRAGILWSILF